MTIRGALLLGAWLLVACTLGGWAGSQQWLGRYQHWAQPAALVMAAAVAAVVVVRNRRRQQESE